MEDQLGKRVVAFPEFTYADGFLIKVRVENRAFRLTIRRKVGKPKREGEEDDMVSAWSYLAAILFAEPLQMIGDAILFRRISDNRRKENLAMLGKVGIDFLRNG